MLGTGNALVTDCYNTCFLLENDGQKFMVDGGGGNGILKQLKRADCDWMSIRHIAVTHKHTDHFMGIVWMVRMICRFMNHGEYKGEAFIYSHDEVLNLIRDCAAQLLPKKETHFIDDRLHLVEVADGSTLNIIGRDVTFLIFNRPKPNSTVFA